jgi:hypothetical protein
MTKEIKELVEFAINSKNTVNKKELCLKSLYKRKPTTKK